MLQFDSIFVSYHEGTTPVVALVRGNDLLGMWNGDAASWAAEALKVALPGAQIVCDPSWYAQSKQWWDNVKKY